MKLWKIAGKHFALGLLADLIATCSEARRGRVDLIVAGIGVAICIGYIAWRY
jgi:hypothetical protein